MAKFYKKPFDLLSFEEFVVEHKDKFTVNLVTGCWEWHGARGGNCSRYGRVGIGKGNKMRPAHTVFYEKKYGKIPKGLEPHHECKNEICVFPEHMKLLTHQENCNA